MTASDQSNTGQTEVQGTMQDQALFWLLKQRDDAMDAAAWEAFTLWLEEDARHADVYDALVRDDEALDGLRGDMLAAPALPEAANDNPVRRILSWATAGVAALFLGVLVWPDASAEMRLVTTAAGEMQTIALTDDIVINVNGASTVSFSESEPLVQIAEGEVAFAVTSDMPSPLRIEVADIVLTDIGTVFNVTLDDEALSIAVAEGMVAINPESDNVMVEAGQIMERPVGTTTFTRRNIAADAVASWREGRLEFDDTPMADALAQIERSAGVTLVAPGFADARLTGSIVVTGDDAAWQKLWRLLSGSVQGQMGIAGSSNSATDPCALATPPSRI